VKRFLKGSKTFEDFGEGVLQSFDLKLKLSETSGNNTSCRCYLCRALVPKDSRLPQINLIITSLVASCSAQVSWLERSQKNPPNLMTSGISSPYRCPPRLAWPLRSSSPSTTASPCLSFHPPHREALHIRTACRITGLGESLLPTVTKLLVLLGPAPFELPPICISTSSFPPGSVFATLCLYVDALEEVILFIYFASVVAFPL
jgi:hypothetical protein